MIRCASYGEVSYMQYKKPNVLSFNNEGDKSEIDMDIKVDVLTSNPSYRPVRVCLLNAECIDRWMLYEELSRYELCEYSIQQCKIQ